MATDQGPPDTQRGTSTVSPAAAAWYAEGKWRYRAEAAWGWLSFEHLLQFGRVISAIKLPFFLLHTPAGYGVLVTIGRKTGRARRKLVRVISDGDVAYLVAIFGGYAAWVKNIRARPQVRLRIHDRWYSGTAAEISPTDHAQAQSAYCHTVTPFDYITCTVHRRGRPTRAKIIELTTAWFHGGLPIKVHLTPAAPRR